MREMESKRLDFDEVCAPVPCCCNLSPCCSEVASAIVEIDDVDGGVVAGMSVGSVVFPVDVVELGEIVSFPDTVPVVGVGVGGTVGAAVGD